MIAGLSLRPLVKGRRRFLAVAATGSGSLVAARDDGALLCWREGVQGEVAAPTQPVTVLLRAQGDLVLAGTAGAGVALHVQEGDGWRVAWRAATEGRRFRYVAATAALPGGAWLAGTGEGLLQLGPEGQTLGAWDDLALGCGYVTGLWAQGERWAVGTLTGLAVTADGGETWEHFHSELPVRDAVPLTEGWLGATDGGLRVWRPGSAAGEALGARATVRRLVAVGDKVAAIGPGGVALLVAKGTVLREANVATRGGMPKDGCLAPDGGLALAASNGLWLLDAEALDHAIERGAVDA